MSETISANTAAKSSVQQAFTNCPNAVWMVVDSEMLQCFCTIMYTASWKSTERNLIPLCDGIMMGTDEEQS